MCLHQKNYKHKAAYFTGNQVKFSTPFRITKTKFNGIKRVQTELSFCFYYGTIVEDVMGQWKWMCS